MQVLGLIPARGGSKGIPRKNLRELGGKPLIAYTIESAKAAKQISRIIVSTDDAQIADVAKQCGAEVPFMRPPELAQDDTPTLKVIVHALEILTKTSWQADAICLLQPTFPFRESNDIDRCIAALNAQKADCAISVRTVPHRYNPHWVLVPNQDGSLRFVTGEKAPIIRRQELPPAYYRTGSVYVTRRNTIEKYGNVYGERVIGIDNLAGPDINLDTLEDWQVAEAHLKTRHL